MTEPLNPFIETCAEAAHEINRAYCAALGDFSQLPWAQAPEWQRESARAGVAFRLNNPDATPEQSHESWLAVKAAEGWAHGPVKDVEQKLHPCFRPYSELPVEQRAKDHLFLAAVAQVSRILQQTSKSAFESGFNAGLREGNILP